jgi:hypothetical protein
MDAGMALLPGDPFGQLYIHLDIFGWISAVVLPFPALEGAKEGFMTGKS